MAFVRQNMESHYCALCPCPQLPFKTLGIKFSGTQNFEILKHMSGVLVPVRERCVARFLSSCLPMQHWKPELAALCTGPHDAAAGPAQLRQVVAAARAGG